MNFNEHWGRWIVASVAKHFEIGIDTFECEPTNLFVEGFERETSLLPDWLELRVDGPYTEEMTKGCWQLDVEINIAVCVNEPIQDAYRINRLCGGVTKLLIDCIDVYKLGDRPDDDNTLLGCLMLKTDGRDRIVQSNFGKVRPDTRHHQSSVEAHYRMKLG